MKRGTFVTFEGGEGAGKSTQAKLLVSELERRGVRVVHVREPGGTPLAETIRGILKDNRGEAPCAEAETLLFLAARAQLVRKTILPALEEGAWVVSDRFGDSTLAYQGYGRGMPLSAIAGMNDFACAGLKPDLTILLDISPEDGGGRVRARSGATGVEIDRMELAGRDFHSRLREGFLALAAGEKDRFAVIDAMRTVEEIRGEVWKSVSRFL
jgi:dTMP kinase